MLEPALELLGVQAAGEVRAVAVLVVRPVPLGRSTSSRHERLLDSREALGLGGEGLLEGELLAAGARHHLVVRVRPLDGIAQKCDQADVGERRRHARRDGRMEHVVRRRLAGLEVVAALPVTLPRRREREEGAIPVDALRELLVEEVRLLHPPDR